jgi:hypothetical protein
MGPNESGLDAGARLKTPRPMNIYITEKDVPNAPPVYKII